MTVVNATFEGVNGFSDDSVVLFRSPRLRGSGDSEVIVTRKSIRVKPEDGEISVDLDPGLVEVSISGGSYLISVPTSGPVNLWDLIAAAIPFPEGTPSEAVGAAVSAHMKLYPGEVALSAVGSAVDELVPPAVEAEVQTVTPGIVTPYVEDLDFVPVAGPTPGKIRITFGDGGTTDEFNPLPASVDSVTGLDGRLDARGGSDAFIDFTTKPDGVPPTVLDTGQPVDFISEAQNDWQPIVADGQLVHGTLPASGPYAAYYQAVLDGDCYEGGMQWVVDGFDGSSTEGIACLAVWGDVYSPASGMDVPKHLIHITVSTTMPSANYHLWVSDGDDDNFTKVGTWSFDVPASDGVALWETAFRVDLKRKIIYLDLPGNMTYTASSYVQITEDEVNAALALAGKPSITFANLLAGSNVIVAEHYAYTDAATARYPRFLNLWGNVLRPARAARAALERRQARDDPAIAGIAQYVRYAPSPAANTPVPTTFTDVPGDGGGLAVTFLVPTWSTTVRIEAHLYYAITGAGKILVCMREGASLFDVQALVEESAGWYGVLTYVGYREGLIPGTTHTVNLQHMCTTENATLMLDAANGCVASMEASFR